MSDYSLNFDDDLPQLWVDGEPPAPKQKKQAPVRPATSDEIGAAEQEAEAELTEMLQGFRKRARSEDQRYLDATDSEYWFCLCFQTREQKEEFLQLMGWLDFGDKYLDGLLVAQSMGRPLTSRMPRIARERAVDQKLLALTDDEE